MLEQLFGSRTRTKLMYLFLENPENIFFVREITRAIGERINSVRRELDNLERFGLIKSKTDNQKRYYGADKNFVLFNELKTLIDKSKLLAERLVLNKDGRFMTCNMSMKREILDELGGFDTAFDVGQEDVELGLRALKRGKIVFAQDMIVYHRVERYTVKRLFTDARRYKTQVMIFKRHPNADYHLRHSPPRARGIFLKPEDWWIIFCPIILFRSPSNQSPRDFLLIPFIYAATIYRRIIIWKTALKERVLLI